MAWAQAEYDRYENGFYFSEYYWVFGPLGTEIRSQNLNTQPRESIAGAAFGLQAPLYRLYNELSLGVGAEVAIGQSLLLREVWMLAPALQLVGAWGFGSQTGAERRIGLAASLGAEAHNRFSKAEGRLEGVVRPLLQIEARYRLGNSALFVRYGRLVGVGAFSKHTVTIGCLLAGRLKHT
jgi:hypothetical protein